MAQDFSALTDQEIEDIRQRIDGQVAALKAEARTAQAVLDQRAAERKAAGTLASLSPAERTALAQAIAADGIATAEAFGAPSRG